MLNFKLTSFVGFTRVTCKMWKLMADSDYFFLCKTDYKGWHFWAVLKGYKENAIINCYLYFWKFDTMCLKMWPTYINFGVEFKFFIDRAYCAFIKAYCWYHWTNENEWELKKNLMLWNIQHSMVRWIWITREDNTSIKINFFHL